MPAILRGWSQFLAHLHVLALQLASPGDMQRSFLFAAVALLLSPWVATEVAAAGGKATSDCGYSCKFALQYAQFKGSDKKESNFVKQCKNPLRIQSIYACMESFCSPAEIDVGYEALNADCEEMVGLSMPSYDSIIKDIKLDELQPLAYMNRSTTVNDTVVPTRDLYQLAYRTRHDRSEEISHDWVYSYAMAGFWAVVIFVGICYRFAAFFRSPAPDSALAGGDVESRDEKRKMRWNQRIVKLLNKHVILPAAFGKNHQEPLGGIFMVPTRIQGLFIVAFVALNIALIAVHHPVFDRNLYWPKKSSAAWRYLADRTGFLCFGNLPLVWLFATRNNVLLWLTGWSFSTYNMFHRWVARVATFEAAVHGIGYTVYALQVGGSKTLKADYNKLYWQMGVVAVICFGLLMGFSLLPLREKCYEFFLMSHIVLALLSLITLFFHVAIFEGEFDPYLWACVGIWCFDRLLRLARVIIINYKAFALKDVQARAHYSEEADMIYLEVEPSFHLRPNAGAFYYLYFPTWWGRWESHPFTLSTWSYGNRSPFLEHLPRKGSLEEDKKEAFVSESPVSPADSLKLTPVSSPSQRLTLTFLIRPCDGVTKLLRKEIFKSPNKVKDLRVLVEGPYGEAEHLNGYERVLYVAGGSGITAITSSMLSLADRAERKGNKCPVPKNIHIVWAARQSGLLREVYEHQLQPLMSRLAAAGSGTTISIELYQTRDGDQQVNPVTNVSEHPAINVQQTVGQQPNIPEIVYGNAADAKDNMAIFICGPGRIADVTRSAACEAQTRTAATVDFFEEAFAW